MKKLILFAAILFAGVSVVKADEPPATPALINTDNVTLNVNLNPIQTIFVNPEHSKVNLDYKSVKDYNEGVTSTQSNHLTVYSTGAFGVSVKAGETSISGNRGKEIIKAIGLNVLASAGNTSSLDDATYTISGVNLSSEFKEIISSTVGGVNKNFDITYSALGDNSYINKYIKGDGATVYSTELTYSIVAK